MSATDGRLICDSDAVAANSSYTLATGKINEHQRCAQDVGVAWGSIFAYMMVCFGIGAVIAYVLLGRFCHRLSKTDTCFSVLG